MTTKKLPHVPDILDDGALTIYVDGSMYGGPRRGGMGVLFVWVNDAGDEETWDPAIPSTMGATNNEMELEAPIEALRMVGRGKVPVELARFNKVVIRTDSLYVHNNVPNAISTWRKTGWVTKGGASVLHSRMWKRLIAEMKGLHDRDRLLVHFEWVPGKKGRLATVVDKLAKKSANSASFGRARPNLVRRKLSAASVEPGSVKVEGQTMTVRIVQAQYIPPPRRGSRYKYEVIEDGNLYDGKVDRAESNVDLKQGHTYVVRFNDVQENPRIEELIEEVEEDLTPYLDALRELGKPSTARQVVDELNRARRLVVTSAAARRRLDRLVGSDQARCARSRSVGRPYLYEIVIPGTGDSGAP